MQRNTFYYFCGMETKPTYLDFFDKFSGKLSYADITLEISSIRWRFYCFVAFIVLLVSSFMRLFLMYYLTLHYWALAITVVFCFLLLIFIYFALGWLNKFDLKAMLKIYTKLYDLSNEERTKITALVNRVRYERLKKYFKEDINRTDYISSLKDDAKESADETKKELNVTSLGIVSVVLVILSAYLSALFNLWKNDSFVDLSMKTIIIVLYAGTFCLAAYMIKKFHLFVVNLTHSRHMELYKILKDLEKKSKFR
jgi:hypothetical protein